MLKTNFLVTIFCVSFIFSAQAADYINNDLAAPVSSGTDYDNVTVVNSRTLSSGSLIGGFLYLGGDISGDVDITNTGSLTSTHSNYGIFYLPNVGNISSTKTINVTNEGDLETTGGFAIPIYILGNLDGDPMGDDPLVRRSYDFELNNSGTITSAHIGTHIINGDSGSFTITNSGTITTSSSWEAIKISGGNVTITNSGTISTNSASNDAIEVTGDNFTLNILNGSNITGKINASGDNNVLNIGKNVNLSEFNAILDQLTGTWVKNISSGAALTIGSGESQSIASGESFAAITLSGGSVSNSGTLGTLSVSGSGNALTLATGSTTGNITNNGTLTISPGSANLTYSNAISGTGSITKTGSGRLELSGTNTYNGATTVSAGELKVNGNIASSAVTINSGAMISGTGTVGALTVESGASLAAGNSVGTLNVSGDLTLNSGSTTIFEFNRTAIDKIIATGNVTVAGTANFQLLDTDGYFTVTQNIIETTGGTISGTFDSVTTDNGFSTSLTYGSTAVSATVSKTLNSNTLDGVLSSQNSVGRLISKSLTDQLRNSRYFDNKKTTAWISGGGFGSYVATNGDSAAYSTNGYLTSAGLLSNNGDYQIAAGVFNSKASVKRFIYSGDDDIDSNGFAIGIGKNSQNFVGDLYAFTQLGVGFYSFDTRRNVNVNGEYQIGRGSGNGGFQYIGVGAAQTIKTNLSGEVGIFASTNLQRTQHNRWSETGLSVGNLDVSRSVANTLNFELGTSYKNDLPKFLHLNKGSFYQLELTGYKSELYSKKNAIITQSTTSYSLSPTYNQEFTLGASAFFSTPISQNSTITTRFDKRQNGSFREFIATASYLYNF